MIANMAKKAFEPKRPGFFIRPRYIILFFILTFFVLGGVYLSQQTKLQSIAEEKVTLQTELDSLKVEEERLERMLEYMQTTDYLIQYAREKLGYVFPDDWKFYDPNEEAEVTPKMVETPTPLPRSRRLRRGLRQRRRLWQGPHPTTRSRSSHLGHETDCF
jgi:cell division protein FtsB